MKTERGDRVTTLSPPTSIILSLLRPMLVSDGLRVADHSVGCFGSIRPEVEDNPVRLSCHCRDFLGLGLRHIENLYTTCGNLNIMVMVILIPGFQRYFFTREGLGNEILDIRQPGIGIG